MSESNSSGAAGHAVAIGLKRSATFFHPFLIRVSLSHCSGVSLGVFEDYKFRTKSVVDSHFPIRRNYPLLVNS
ncbi:hypothetical protein JTE90_002259 [Oedothorax gibbosus]|uniref:Uncharacterized protein n=1 Tax=Oedothorax gibbosus TaxID=931172 RepID=A0AAV6V5Z5_9ARAC|nr:hypothetical protein JTE90_002259 [Oedothorax gibbosus]